MSQQVLDLRRSLRTIRRYRILVAVIAGLGFLLGAVFTVLSPPMLSSQALVVLPPGIRDSSTQVVIADSVPVVARAMRHVHPALPLETLVGRVHVTNPTPDLIQISAQAKTAAQAEQIANAVARSYISYTGSANTPGGQVLGRLLQPATTASGTPFPVSLAITGGLGLLAGLVAGSIAALGLGRGDRKLRERDQIAGAVGLPVLASVPVAHPSGPAGWRRLLDEYEPGAVEAWGMRKALHQLGMIDFKGADGPPSLTVLTLSSDYGALALGPQLAVYAASLGIPAALIVDSQPDVEAAATLRAAVGVASGRPSGPPDEPARVVLGEHSSGRPRITIVVAALDSQTPLVADTMRTTATILGVSAGAATAEQLARLAVSAADDGRDLAGIVVANPDPDDRTSGRLPRLAEPVRRRLPSRLAGPAPFAARSGPSQPGPSQASPSQSGPARPGPARPASSRPGPATETGR
jgi:capsular polysaccharide biosynthesis protein